MPVEDDNADLVLEEERETRECQFLAVFAALKLLLEDVPAKKRALAQIGAPTAKHLMESGEYGPVAPSRLS